jgi:hypothetical protein
MAKYETVEAVKNDVKKVKKTIGQKLRKSATVAAVGAGFIGLAYLATKKAVHEELEEAILVIKTTDLDGETVTYAKIDNE